jgi:hypothetical protein
MKLLNILFYWLQLSIFSNATAITKNDLASTIWTDIEDDATCAGCDVSLFTSGLHMNFVCSSISVKSSFPSEESSAAENQTDF